MLFIEINLKGENNIHPVDILSYSFDPFFLPGPELWGDIIKYPVARLVGKLRNAEVKSRIIDQDNHIRFEFAYLLACKEQDSFLLAPRFLTITTNPMKAVFL